MFKSSARQLFFLSILLLCVSSCNYWRESESGGSSPSGTPENFSQTAAAAAEIPFSNQEPEIYQAEIVSLIFTATGEKIERKTFAARSGAKRITIFNFGDNGEIARLETNENSIFTIHRGKKVYAERQSAEPDETGENDFLTTEWLNQKSGATFEKLETENNLTKFRVRFGDAGENAVSEILVYVDENLKLPVRQEFYSISGERKTLMFSVELKNFKAEAGENLFELPKDYRQISAPEFQEILWKERAKNE